MRTRTFGSMSWPRALEPLAMDGAGFGRHEAAVGVDRRPCRRAARSSRRTRRTPALHRAASAPHRTPPPRSHPSRRAAGPRQCRTAGRRAATGSSGANSSPAMTASALAQSATLRASGPIGIERDSYSGNAPVGRHALPARLEADDAAERRRNAHRAAGVGADGDLAHAVGDRDRGARGRAARHARAVGRIAGRAEMRIGADGAEKANSVMLVLATITAPAGAQPPHDRRVGGRRRCLLGEHFASRRASARRRHRTDP